MKVAYMVMAHKNMEQIKRLIYRLETGGGDIYVHVDSTVCQEDFLHLREQCQSDRCFFIQPRMHGVLDDPSLIDITMLCINKALLSAQDNDFHYDYYALISGQDYPIKPVKWIESQLERTYPMPYIESYSKSENGENAAVQKYDRSRGLILYRNWVLGNFHGIIRKSLQGAGVLMRKVLKFCNQTTAQKLQRQGITVCMGSAWWILPDKIIEPVFEAYKKKDGLIQTLINESVTPEETFFQTICRDKSYESLFDLNGEKKDLRNCKTYTDFGRKSNRKPVCHPYVLTIEDFERLKQSTCWFARKFDESVDVSIIQKIETELL